MSHVVDPERLVASSEVSADVRGLLERAGQDGASPQDLARLRARLLTPGGSGGLGKAVAGSPAKMATGTGWLALQVGGGALVVVALAVGAWHATGGRAGSHLSDSRPMGAPVVPAASALTEHPISVAQPPAEVPALPVSELPLEPSTDSRHAVSVGGGAGASSATPSETDLLDAARRALRDRPETTLQLTGRHRALYPHGILAQEREVLEVDALARLGRDDEARRRAESFRKQNPNSVYGRRVDDTTAPSVPLKE